MSSRFSTLQRATRADVRSDPFPYIVVRNALPDEVYNELIEKFPPLSVLGVDKTQNNKRWNMFTRDVVRSKEIASVWREFIAYQASPDFFREIVELFHTEITELYPRQFPSLSYMRSLRVGVRLEDNFSTKDVLMDAMISGNTPVKSASSVRTTHVDQGRKLFSGLFYMRREGDDSKGGDLTISRFKPQFADDNAKSALFEGSYVDDENVEIVETVKYEKNLLVIFINSIDSLHGVTVREPTTHGRYFVNLIGDAVAPLYRFSKGRPHYVRLSWPMDAVIPPLSVAGRRIMSRFQAQKSAD